MMWHIYLKFLCIIAHYRCLVNILVNKFDEKNAFLYKYLALCREIKYNKRI
jgi:hypothetical protein